MLAGLQLLWRAADGTPVPGSPRLIPYHMLPALHQCTREALEAALALALYDCPSCR